MLYPLDLSYYKYNVGMSEISVGELIIAPTQYIVDVVGVYASHENNSNISLFGINFDSDYVKFTSKMRFIFDKATAHSEGTYVGLSFINDNLEMDEIEFYAKSITVYLLEPLTWE